MIERVLTFVIISVAFLFDGVDLYLKATHDHLHLSSIDYYFVFLLASTWLLAIYLFLNRYPKETMQTQVAFLGISALTAVWHSFSIHKLAIWADEEAQFFLPHRHALVRAAAGQHQPPLDMAFSYLAQFLFSNPELSARIFPLLFSSLSTGLVFLIGFRISKNWVWSLFLAAVFSCQQTVKRYATEGRPISLGVFCCLLLILFLIDALKNPRHKNLIWLFIATLLFLLSVGMQPVIAVLTLLFLLVLMNLIMQKLDLALFGYVICAFILFLPVFQASFDMGVQTHDFVAFDFTLLKRALSQAFHFYQYPAFFSVDGNLYFLNLILFLLSLVQLIRLSKQQQDSSEARLLFVLSGLSFLFLFYYIPFFTHFINGHLNDRYIIVSWVFTLSSLSAALIEAEAFVTKKIWRNSILGGAIVVTIILSLPVIQPKEAIKFGDETDVREFYSWVNGVAQKGDLLLKVCLHDVDTTYCPDWFSGSIFYHKDRDLYHTPILAVLESDNKYTLPETRTWANHLSEDFSVGEAFFLVLQGGDAAGNSIMTRDDFAIRIPSCISIAKQNDYTVFKFSGDKGLKTAHQCVNELIQVARTDGSDSRSLHILLGLMDLRLGHLQEALQECLIIKKLKPEEGSPNNIWNLNKIERALKTKDCGV